MAGIDGVMWFHCIAQLQRNSAALPARNAVFKIRYLRQITVTFCSYFSFGYQPSAVLGILNLEQLQSDQRFQFNGRQKYRNKRYSTANCLSHVTDKTR